MSIEVLSAKSYADLFVKELDWRRRHPELARLWKTGFTEWDQIVGGIGRGWYIVVVGPQKGGKTALMNSLKINLARLNSIRYLYVTLEMDYVMLATRTFSNMGEISMNKMRGDALSLTDEDMEILRLVSQEEAEFDGYYNYGARSIAEVETLIRYLKPDVAILDYMGLMTTEDESGRMSRYQEINQISRRMKQATLPPKDTNAEAIDRSQLITMLEGRRNEFGKQTTDEMITYMQQCWNQMDDTASQVPLEDQPPVIRGSTTIITAIQTSKEAQKKGKLDATSPKDSNAPFEDCDLGLAINFVFGPDEEPVPNLRRLDIVASRVSSDGSMELGYNPSQAKFFSDPAKANRPDPDLVF